MKSDPRVDQAYYAVLETLFGSGRAAVMMSEQCGHYIIVPNVKHMDRIIEMGAKPSRVLLGSELPGGNDIMSFLIDEATGVIEFTDEDEEER